jgi:hypothetical protein
MGILCRRGGGGGNAFAHREPAMERDQNARPAAGDERTLQIALANPGGLDLAGMTARYVVARSPFHHRP